MNERIAALTFDDGLTQHHVVAKYLYGIGIKASFLIPVGSIGNSLSDEQIGEIGKDGHELVSHGVTHRNLPELNLEDLIFELSISKEVLETYQSEVRGFGYPGGAYNNLVIKHVAKYYDYARSFNSSCNIANHPFTDVSSPYTLGAIDVREIKRIPYIHNKASPIVLGKLIGGKPLILMFHQCSIKCVTAIIRMLTPLGYRFVTLKEVYRYLFKD